MVGGVGLGVTTTGPGGRASRKGVPAPSGSVSEPEPAVIATRESSDTSATRVITAGTEGAWRGE
jgi:hypothetical protein